MTNITENFVSCSPLNFDFEETTRSVVSVPLSLHFCTIVEEKHCES